MIPMEKDGVKVEVDDIEAVNNLFSAQQYKELTGAD